MTLNQNGIGANIGHTISNTICLWINIYPTECRCCSLGVVVASLGGIDAYVIGHTQLYLLSTTCFDVKICNTILVSCTFRSTMKRQFPV